MAAVKKSISMPESLYKLAEQAAAAEHYGKFSDYVQAVIEADVARRKTQAATLHEEPPIKYLQRRQKRDTVPKR